MTPQKSVESVRFGFYCEKKLPLKVGDTSLKQGNERANNKQ